MVQLPPELWEEITKYNAINVPPPRMFLTSVYPPTALHEYPSAYESVSGQDLLWLKTVSTLSQVDRRLRYMYRGECPVNCLVVTEVDIRDKRAQLEALNPSAICVRHLMIVLSSPPCGHGEDAYAGTARELYLDLLAIVRCLRRLTVVTLSVLNGQCKHNDCIDGQPLYFVDAFQERVLLRQALVDAQLQRLQFLEGAQALLPPVELTRLINGSSSLRVASFSQRYDYITWKGSDHYTGLTRTTRLRVHLDTIPNPLYIALPTQRNALLELSDPYITPRKVNCLVVDATVGQDLRHLIHSNYEIRSLALHNLSYGHDLLREALRDLPSSALEELCIVAPLPVLMRLGDRLQWVLAPKLSLAIPARVAGLNPPSVETLPWARLLRLMEMLLALEDHPRCGIKSVRFPQQRLAKRLREEIATRAVLRATVRASPVRFVDEEGSALDV
ncbi:unnamed protein product [Peniophora sp. CBMAI 1063]|nr:unnamed protein product [Peniophora sp. CBMAI 1063]